MQTWKWGGILLSGLAAACDGPPPSSPGVETAKPSRSRADTPSPSRTGDPAPFQIDDIQIGIPTQHYLDPEFIDVGGHYKALYTDGVHVPGSLWVADIDPVTGMFVSGHGKDLLLDTEQTS
jgi:hypothetical protein